ncbi:hypothetical protein B969_01365 [Brucella suis F5/05-4]|nr:hypothetical protein BPI_I1128 [Brucella pinnipedialis B2/94]ENT43824.1 hypothetical protein B969_01883 [Brucella suis F5/05-4]ENT44345.1 hypothetical protein B969_01365 [Brucella suis F5/05-4]CDL76478.1 unnamed protein product [Brucella canis str. Oliveri]
MRGRTEGVPRGFVAADVCRCLGIHIRSDGRINTNRALSKLTASEKQNLPYKEAHLRGLKEVAARAYGVSLVSESGLYKHTSGGSRRHLSRLDGDEKYTLRINEGIRGNPNATFITRSGINKLISHRRSCDPAAGRSTSRLPKSSRTG